MPRLTAHGADVEIGEHPRFERFWRLFQRLLFTCFGLIVAAGLAGLTGSGPLAARRRALDGGAFTLEVPRFARVRAPERITITPNVVPAGRITVRLAGALVRDLQIRAITPAPLASASGPDGLTLLFATTAAASGPIVVQAQPAKVGPTRGTISVGGDMRPVRQMVWP